MSLPSTRTRRMTRKTSIYGISAIDCLIRIFKGDECGESSSEEKAFDKFCRELGVETCLEIDYSELFEDCSTASSISNISLVRGNYNPTNQIPLMGKKGRSKKHSKEPNNNIDQVSDNLTRYGAIKVEVPDNWTPPSVARKPTPLVMRSSRLPVKTPSSEQVSQSTGSPVYRPIRQCGSRIPRLQLNTQSTCSKTPPTDSSPSNSQFDSTASVSNQTEKRFAVRRLNFSECTDPAAQGEEDSRLPVYVVEGKMITDERNSMASVPPLDYISAPSEYSPFKKDTATPESIGREAEIKAMRQHA
ncbi:hypothetical protein WR25_08297 [Diploscapter pachys]|uniref:Uncharacterized protein n=1 Tax=Diploscapter pachys TaxID=2018661 RepID=A0A2A2KY62_9BILA|nr:hypothetical protein WR25_08297 [Diploscapter pachys]